MIEPGPLQPFYHELIVQQEVSGAAAALLSSKGNTGAENIILTGTCPLWATPRTQFSAVGMDVCALCGH